MGKIWTTEVCIRSIEQDEALYQPSRRNEKQESDATRTNPSIMITTEMTRSEEVSALLQPVLAKLIEFLAKADCDGQRPLTGSTSKPATTALLSNGPLDPEALTSKIKTSLSLPSDGNGKDGLLETLQHLLDYSVNTTAPGFLDKLYASPLPPGIAADLILTFLNTNVHVYQVAPVLTLIEKHCTRQFAKLFGLVGPRAGGINVQGGSASNLTSIVVARNHLYPQTKTQGNSAVNGGKLMVFTSAHSHYSIEKAAQALGLGSQNVVSVPVTSNGAMISAELDRLMSESKARGEIPFYVNATAGSTVLGSFDPFVEIAAVAKKHRCWFHIDGAWGGGFVFAERKDMRNRLNGSELADSIAVNPHKMLGVPLTCSFLLTRDLKVFQTAMTLKAGYLFHDAEEEDHNRVDDETKETKDLVDGTSHPNGSEFPDIDSEAWDEPYDLADLTLQCGRRGDSLKFFLSWQYYGTKGYEKKVENAYEIAIQLFQLVSQGEDFKLVLDQMSQPECLQVCFYYTPGGKFTFGTANEAGRLQVPGLERDGTPLVDAVSRRSIGKHNTRVTARITKALISRGFMIDYAPALEGYEDKGSFFRVVVNISTEPATIKKLVEELENTGQQVVGDLERKYGPE